MARDSAGTDEELGDFARASARSDTEPGISARASESYIKGPSDAARNDEHAFCRQQAGYARASAANDAKGLAAAVQDASPAT